MTVIEIQRITIERLEAALQRLTSAGFCRHVARPSEAWEIRGQEDVK